MITQVYKTETFLINMANGSTYKRIIGSHPFVNDDWYIVIDNVDFKIKNPDTIELLKKYFKEYVNKLTDAGGF